MKLRTMGGPAFPTRGFRGHVPLAPEPGSEGAAPKPPAAPADPPAPPPKAPAPPAPPAPPSPPPAPEKKGGVSPEVAAELLALKAEREALAAEKATWQSECAASQKDRQTEVATQRREYIRAMGLAVDFADEDLDKLVPAEDPRTAAGKAKLNEWREKGGARYFAGPTPAPAFDPEKFAEEVAGGKDVAGKRVIFNAGHARGMLGG